MGTYYNTLKKKISRHWELNAKNVAEIAIKQGIPTHVNFFSNDLAKIATS